MLEASIPIAGKKEIGPWCLLLRSTFGTHFPEGTKGACKFRFPGDDENYRAYVVVNSRYILVSKEQFLTEQEAHDMALKCGDEWREAYLTRGDRGFVCLDNLNGASHE